MTIKTTRNQPALKAMAELFKDKDNFFLACHTGPDGDALGSMLALGQALKTLGKKVRLYSRDGVPSLYSFLPGCDEVTDRSDAGARIDIAVLLDCHTLSRAGASFISPPVLAALDHHLTNGSVPEAALIDASSSSTGELVYCLVNELSVNISRDMAVNLLTAISTDTGSFSYSNTTVESLEIAADLVKLGATPWEIYKKLNLNMPPGRLQLLSQALNGIEYFHHGQVGVLSVTSEMMRATATSEPDTEDFINYPRSVQGVELAILIRENERRHACHVSLRSRGSLNVAHLAEAHGGGGHHNAAGFSAAGSVGNVKKNIVAEAEAFFQAAMKKDEL